MKILIISPSLNPHGGIRVLIEWANGLARRGHAVTLQVEAGPVRAEWAKISPEVEALPGPLWDLKGYDIAVAGGPDIALRLDQMKGPANKFFLLQMAEDMFAPSWRNYVDACRRSYQVKMPIIGISRWVEQYVRQWRGAGDMYYIGNGVSEDFKPGKKDRDLAVVVECWGGYPGNSNPAKDIEQLGPQCAAHLKQKYGARIIALSQFQAWVYAHVPDDYIHQPSHETWIRTMQRGHLLVKASRLDARSTAPVEAMACGMATARALVQGDDDLHHEYNCLRGGYTLDELISNAERLIEDAALRAALEANGLQYRRQYLSWDYWLGKAEEIFAGKYPSSGEMNEMEGAWSEKQ